MKKAKQTNYGRKKNKLKIKDNYKETEDFSLVNSICYWAIQGIKVLPVIHELWHIMK